MSSRLRDIKPMPPEEIAKLKAAVESRWDEKPWYEGGPGLGSPGCMMRAEEFLSLIAATEANDSAPTPILRGEVVRLKAALQFYADEWCFTVNQKRPGLEWKPTEVLLDDCGNTAREALAAASGGSTDE
jgi:hypothetical protein